MAFGASKAAMRRGIQNSEYAFWAMMELSHHLDEHPELGLLIGVPERNVMESAAIQLRNLGVLSELGRILKAFGNGEDACLQLALEYVDADPRPSVKEMIRRLRDFRRANLGLPVMKAVGTVEGMRDAILDAILDYQRKNPATDLQIALEALDEAYCRLADAMEAPER
jgi:hypothetical protein